MTEKTPRVYGPPAVYLLYTLDITADILRLPQFQVFRLMPQAKYAMEQRIRDLIMQGYVVRNESSTGDLRSITLRNQYRALQVCCRLIAVQ